MTERRRATSAREVAFRVISAVTEDDAYANIMLPREIAQASLRADDAGLATELCYGTLRHRGTYDAVIAAAAEREPDTIDPPVRDALRLGVHQLFATRIAAHAAVNETVDLVRTVSGPRAAGFANAVLRRISARSAGEWMTELTEAARSDDEALALSSSHPVWIIRALRRALRAEDRAEELPALLEADNAAPGVTMTALPGLAEREGEPTPYSPVGFRLGGGSPERLVRGSGGAIRVQDEGSQLVALALSRSRPVRQGERWLDLCAGPGGKTALLAADALAFGASLEANEVAPHRAALVRGALDGVPLEVPVHIEDGRNFASAHPASFDRILVDAPCTGLGALRRRPEARWRKQPADVPALADLQWQLLASAGRAVAPGGLIAYVTCSPHLAETVAVVDDVIARSNGRLVAGDARGALRAVSDAPLDLPGGAGHAQLWPHRHGTDAMFLALIERTDTPEDEQ